MVCHHPSFIDERTEAESSSVLSRSYTVWTENLNPGLPNSKALRIKMKSLSFPDLGNCQWFTLIGTQGLRKRNKIGNVVQDGSERMKYEGPIRVSPRRGSKA